MASVRIEPALLKGTILAQPSKSMAHRAIICAALANGTSKLDNIVLSDDIAATLGAVKVLGADAVLAESDVYKGRLCVTITSQGSVLLKGNLINCIESGSTARFLMPITRLVTDKVTLTGRGRLVERPFDLYRELFTQKGINYSDCSGKMPITLEGTLVPGEYDLPGDVSSQFVSGLLFALPLLGGSSRIVITNRLESLPYVKMTIQALNEFGIAINHDKDYQNFEIPGNQSYKAINNYAVEGDWSQAAFFCVMGALSGPITIKGLKTESLQGDKVILDILESMEARLSINDNSIEFLKSDLKGVEVDVSQCPDLVPAIAAAGSLARGQTHIINAARLRIKESDRLSATRQQLGALGAQIAEETDSLIINGVRALTGGNADGSGDHRIVMALAAVSASCEGSVGISGSDAVRKSYPEFWDDFAALGGRLETHE